MTNSGAVQNLKHRRARCGAAAEVAACVDALRELASSASAEQRAAQELLALWLLQEAELLPHGGVEARRLLGGLGYRYRLNDAVLCYSDTEGAHSQKADELCRAYDDALPPAVVAALRSAFGAQASYWVEHRYSDGTREASSAFFSYVHDLPASRAAGAERCDPSDAAPAGPLSGLASDGAWVPPMARLCAHLRDLAVLAGFTDCAAATRAEWWAHCRTHASGHQLHFDSDNEGQGAAVRHPILTAICYLGDDGTDGYALGGPTLITSQTLQSVKLPKTGFLLRPKTNRVAFFRSSGLHGVLPGRKSAPEHVDGKRITLMVAFWDTVNVRPGDAPGAARPFPAAGTPGPKWPLDLGEPLARALEGAKVALPAVQAPVVRVRDLWVDVDEEKNAEDNALAKNLRRLPSYCECFQW